MKQEHATGFGMLAASIFAAAFFAIVAPLSGERDLLSIVGTFLVVYFFVALATVILGIPIFIVLNKRKLVRWWSAISSGALVGTIALVAVRASVHLELEAVLNFSMLGGAAGFVFWMFWRTGSRGIEMENGPSLGKE